MKEIFRKGQKGFTLVELMVVMAIIAILAAVVIPPVTGTSQTSRDSTVVQDASSVQTAVSKFNADQNLADSISAVADPTVGPYAGASANTSNKWPEIGISTFYAAEFNTANVSVTLQNKDGNSEGDVETFLANNNAVDFTSKLTAASGYLQAVPGSIDTLTDDGGRHNYLWLLNRVTVKDSSDGRAVRVYSLTTEYTSGVTTTLTYKRIY